MPTHERRGTDNRENRQDRWKPAIQLDEEPTIVVREPDAATQVAPQDNQLVSERGILSLKPDLRLEQRGQHGQDKPDEPDHRGNLADSSLNKPELGFRYTQPGWLGHLCQDGDQRGVARGYEALEQPKATSRSQPRSCASE